jgi:tRNA-dihydrouridine synthase B
MKIGNVKVRNGFFLAPMSGFSTAPFRRLCREEGAGLTTSEMISSEAILHHNTHTSSLMVRARGERPYAIQLFGSDPKRISLAASAIEKKCEAVDINLGCPVRHVTRQGAGSALLKNPAKIAAIFDSLSVLKIPYTAKMRLVGTKEESLEIARIVEKGGASLLTVHGRTASQSYSVPPDLKFMKETKQALSIPVIGNGDVSKPEDADRMMKVTGCDGVMIGRAAMGNPFIFSQMNDYFRKGSYEIPTAEDRINALTKFLRYSKYDPFSLVRSQAITFILCMKGAPAIRLKIARARSLEEIRSVIKSLRLGPEN